MYSESSAPFGLRKSFALQISAVMCVAAVVFFMHSEVETPGAPTIAPTSLEVPQASDDDFKCQNVLDWNFFDAKLVTSNLGGKGNTVGAPSNCQINECKGPTGEKEELRYEGVVKEHGESKVDLVVTVASGKYTPNSPKINGLVNGDGKFGVVNIQSNTEVRLKFTLVETGTDTPLKVADNQKILFSVFDFDSGCAQGGKPAWADPAKYPGLKVQENGKVCPYDYEKNAHEYAQFHTPSLAHTVPSDTTVHVEGNDKDGTLKATSGRSGVGEDNPSNPLAMSKIALQSKMSVTYEGKASWEFTFGSEGETAFYSKKNQRAGYPNGIKQSGRNLVFAGRSEGDCACVGVSKWKLQNNLKYNNLGGQGPIKSDPEELRYTDVFGDRSASVNWQQEPVDLVIKVAEGQTYQVANTALNGLWPIAACNLAGDKCGTDVDHQQMAQVNIKCNTKTTFDFAFVKSGTDEPYELSNTFFSVYDLDQNPNRKNKPEKVNHEYVEFTTPPSAWKTTADTQLAQGYSYAGALEFNSTQAGSLDDNPTDPTALNELQKSRSVTVWYSSASKWQVTLGHDGPCTGRNMLFAGPGVYCPAP